MTRYKADYGWQTYETTRHAPGVLTHALVLDNCTQRTVHIEWCGSLEIAARERARVLARWCGNVRGDMIQPTIREVRETSE